MKDNYKYPRWLNTAISFVIAAIIVTVALTTRNPLVWLTGVVVGALIMSFGNDLLNKIYDNN